MRRITKLILGLGGLAALAAGATAMTPGFTAFKAESARYAQLAPDLKTPAERGVAYFAFGDFNSLSSEALQVSASPWKLATAALALKAVGGDVARIGEADLAAIFRSFGFHTPQAFGNWPEHLPKPSFENPVGQNVGFAAKTFPPIAATVGNIGCAGCHSSVMYDADGQPDPTRVWLGAPNGSINLEAYTSALFEAIRAYGDKPDLLMDAVQALYPDTGWRERLTLDWFVIPQVQKVFAEREATIGRLMPFRASLAGATNGLDSLKSRLGLIPDGVVLKESIFNSVPDLGGRLFRTKFLNCGNYAIPGIDHSRAMTPADVTPEHRRALAAIIAYFTVPSMGVTTKVAESSIDHADDITAWMAEYTPQPFPGRIDRALLPHGQAVYAGACASCHGVYDADLTGPALLSFPNWEGDVGTDPQRHRLLSKDVADRVNASYGRHIDARVVASYTAPPLTGLWSSAPYFHNGSVPTLWHMLHPEQRPKRFMVGGHSLDLDKVGLAGVDDRAGGWMPAPGYRPWSTPVEIDTAAFGLGSGGHEKEFAPLSDADKAALIEYLKLL